MYKKVIVIIRKCIKSNKHFSKFVMIFNIALFNSLSALQTLLTFVDSDEHETVSGKLRERKIQQHGSRENFDI